MHFHLMSAVDDEQLIKTGKQFNQPSVCPACLPIPPLCSSSTNTELNSSIPVASFKSTVVLDQARLCTSTSKHRQSMYNVWLCSINLRPAKHLPRMWMKEYKQQCMHFITVINITSLINAIISSFWADLQTFKYCSAITLEHPHSSAHYLPFFMDLGSPGHQIVKTKQ